MDILNKNISELKPYDKNNKKHNTKQIKNVAESIKQYGFVQPIVIDKDNVIVIGHCRYAASKKLGLKQVPCVCVDDLTPEQVNALRIVDNKTNESVWDIDNLNFEIPNVDLSAFDFELSFAPNEEKHEENKEKMQEQVENILNLGYAEFESDNEDGFPYVLPLDDLPDVEQWIPFDWAVREKHPENKGVYFFRDDYRFERVWNNPKKYMNMLKKFKAVISTDFSLYYDTPLVVQKFNQYRNRWLARYWQDNGITVVPLARDSGDRSSFKWCFDGMPKNSWLCFSAMWSKGELAEETVEAFELMKKKLKPKGILLYGGDKYRDRYKADCPIVYIDTFSVKKLQNGDD